jgi:hypothetical protein
VQTGIAILGSVAFGAVALSYGYGFGGGGRSESYPQSTTAEAPPAGPESSFNFTIYDMDYASLSGDTLVIQGFPMPQGAIDTAYVTDSVEIRVEGTEVGAFVEHRGWAYPDGSAKVLFTQFRANPATETGGVLCYSGCTVDSTRISEGSWITHDTTIANVESGPDSIGHYPGRRGYHPVMAFATDSAYLVDSYFLPLATIEEVNGLGGVLATAGDTLPERFRQYSDLMWDFTRGPGIGGTEGPIDSVSVVQQLISVNGASVYGGGCQDWTSATASHELWRRAVGWSLNQNCQGGWTYYDGGKIHQQYGMMRHADSIGVEMIRRGIWFAFADMMYYPPNWTDENNPGCWSGQVNRHGTATSMLSSYIFTGDPQYLEGVKCKALGLSRSIDYNGYGDDNQADGEPRIMAFIMDAQTAAVYANVSPRTGVAAASLLDSLMVWSVNGRGGTPAYSNGIFALDSLTNGCTGAYNENARPTNSLMIPLMVRALMFAKKVTGQDTVVIGTDSLKMPQIMQEISDTMSYRQTMWVDSLQEHRNFFTGNDCNDPDTWGGGLDIEGIHAISLYAHYAYTGLAADQAEADTMLFKATMDSVATISYDFTGGWGGGANLARPHIINENQTTLWEALGWRQCTIQGNC